MRRRLLAATALVAGLAVPGAAARAAGRTGRAQDPIVLTGATVPGLRGAAPGDVVAFAWRGAWSQVSVQVDERLRVDLGQVYGGAPDGVVVEEYADPSTFTGADPDPALDDNDEIALLARDAGDQASGASSPPGVIAGSRVDLRVTDPLDPGAAAYISLFGEHPRPSTPAPAVTRSATTSGCCRATTRRPTSATPVPTPRTRRSPQAPTGGTSPTAGSTMGCRS